MLKSIRSNRPSFKRVDFSAGYSIILADRQSLTYGADQKKTRNGAGKSALVEIIHFCLGARVGKGSILNSKELEGWSFTLEFSIGGFDFEIERGVDDPNKIIIHQLSPELDWDAKMDKGQLRYVAASTYNEELQALFFGPSKSDAVYMPSFHEIISYCIRRNVDGYQDAFEFSKNQPMYSRQACNAYFLDLNMEFVSRIQKLKEEEKKFDDYRKAVASGVVGACSLDVGKLETEVINKKADAEHMRKQIESFRVHPQYNEITDDVNALTEKIHKASNTLILRQQFLELYEKSVKEEAADLPLDELHRIYEEAGVVFPASVQVQLDEVVGFHKALLFNRGEYLRNEIAMLRSEIARLSEEMEKLIEHRAELMQILDSHGALDEYTKLQEKYSKLVQLHEDAKKRKEAALHFEERKSRIKIETQELLLLARHDYAERISARERAVSLFRENAGFIFRQPGTLTIEINDAGYDFDAEIISTKSLGVNCMKVFCYDLLIAELGASRKCHPGFLVHDSIIFNGADERQIASALMLAKRKSEEIGFQYICLMNTDAIPKREFGEQFMETFMDSVVLRLDDCTDTGGLLGIRF
jgi:uncharacterized protein YydD (DUF2326 family)